MGVNHYATTFCAIGAISALFFHSCLPVSAAGLLRPRASALKVNGRAGLLGASAEARFSWRFSEDGRGRAQGAYRLQTASTSGALRSGKNLAADSGRVATDQCTAVVLPAFSPRSAQGYWWRVKLWDKDGREGPWSAPAHFETGLLQRADWTGSWISIPPPGGNGYHSQMTRSDADQKWVQVDLGSEREIQGIRLFPARPYNWQPDTPGFGFPVRYRIEVSANADFSAPQTVVDHTQSDQPNPGEQPVTETFRPVKTRFVRLTATTLYTRADGEKLLALVEMQALDAKGDNLARRASVQAADSIEDAGWSPAQLTDGLTRSAQASVPTAPAFRHEFTLDKPVASARAYVAGLGYCELRINGSKVGDHVLDPSYTTFNRRVLYSTYDVTPLLRPGRNAVAALIGRGWYRSAPCLMLQMNVVFKDGSRKSVTTGPGWMHSDSPILENSLYNGETCDARLEQPGWDKPGFNGTGWTAAELTEWPTQELAPAGIQPIRITDTIRPRTVKEVKDGWVFDFGQNFSGWCRLKVSGPAGTKVTLRHAEVLFDDGSVDQRNLRSARATDVYILKGQGPEVHEPRFTYHGFRYVQLDGFPGKPDLNTVTGCVVRTDLPAHGTFQCADKLINQIQHNAFWGYRTNFHSIPTDCPQRDERQGWMGDAGMTADMGCYNFDTLAAYTKFLQDIQDAQGEDGSVPDTVPHVWGSNPGDPMWSAAYPIILRDIYRHTGDITLLKKHYPSVKRYVDSLEREAPDGILARNNYGDWVGVVDTPKDLISTGSFYLVSDIVAQMAHALGEAADQKHYAGLCTHIADAFNQRFFHPESNSYGNGSQFSNAWPLYLGIVPAEKRKAVTDNLVRDIDSREGHLSTGFLGARALFDVLCDQGRPDIAWTVMTRRDYPGYGYMVEHGATTIWELWTYEAGNGMNSHNHPAFGFISGWFYSHVAGIVPDIQHAGYQVFDVRPYLMPGLPEAGATVDTVRGKVVSHWKRVADGVQMDVTVPANSQARIWVPKNGAASVEISESGTPLWRNGRLAKDAVEGITAGQDAGGWVRLQAGSGTYHFRVEGK